LPLKPRTTNISNCRAEHFMLGRRSLQIQADRTAAACGMGWATNAATATWVSTSTVWPPRDNTVKVFPVEWPEVVDLGTVISKAHGSDASRQSISANSVWPWATHFSISRPPSSAHVPMSIPTISSGASSHLAFQARTSSATRGRQKVSSPQLFGRAVEKSLSGSKKSLQNFTEHPPHADDPMPCSACPGSTLNWE